MKREILHEMKKKRGKMMNGPYKDISPSREKGTRSNPGEGKRHVHKRWDSKERPPSISKIETSSA